MKIKYYLAAIAFFLIHAGYSQTFTTIATDTVGDGFVPSYLDGTKLEYAYDQNTDSLWFRITVNAIGNNANVFGVNVVVNIPGGGNAFKFSGNDNKNKYHRGLTAWVTGTPPSNYNGIIGIFDSVGASPNTNYKNVMANNLRLNLNVANKTITVGLKRKDMIGDAYFTGNTINVTAAAAVGTDVEWNDDIYSSIVTMTLTKTANGVNDVSIPKSDISVYPNPASKKIFFKPGDADEFVDRIEINNLLGETMKKIENAGNRNREIDIRDLPTGIYIIQFKGKDNIITTKKITIF